MVNKRIFDELKRKEHGRLRQGIIVRICTAQAKEKFLLSVYTFKLNF